MDWQEIYGDWVLIPPRPRGVIHFLGGAFVGVAPHLSYRWILEALAKEGYVIIATAFINTFDHVSIARDVLNRFETVLERLQNTGMIEPRYLPIYGIGHSMGCKLHLLIGSLFEVKRAGNILISFNNYPANRSIPLMEQFNTTLDLDIEFTPSPAETELTISQKYEVKRNLLIQFTNDELDQTLDLRSVLYNRFPQMVSFLKLPGNHVTPIGQDISWQTGETFTPWDAIGQWVKQEVYRDLNRLKHEMYRWLDPFFQME